MPTHVFSKIVKIFGLAKTRGHQSATLNELTAKDQWKEEFTTINAMEHIELTTTRMKKALNYVKLFVTEPEFTELKTEVREFEWKSKYDMETIIEGKLRPPNVRLDETAIVNCTNKNIPDDMKMVVSWGKKFAFPTDIIDSIGLITELDTLIENKIPTLMREEAKKLSSIMINEHGKRRCTSDRKTWLNFLGNRAVDFFRKHTNMIIIQSDKGKHSVIMEREQYELKVRMLLSDVNTYERIDTSKEALIKRNDEFVDKLIELGMIGKEDRGKMSDKGTIWAKFYGLPKIHKEGIPLRPITSAINSPGKRLATKLVEVLTPIFKNEHIHVMNSAICKERLAEVTLNPGERLVSFDVVSMFTSIPIELAIRLLGRKREIIVEKTGIPFDVMVKMLEFVLIECAVFTYKSTLFHQKKGLPMGSPISPLIANIIMSDLIKTQQPKFTMQPSFMYVYVDDTLAAIHTSYLNEALKILNEYNDNIQFTMEIEENGAINFLDMTVYRRENKIITNWYKKSYASDRLLNYFSAHKHTMIMNVARAHIRTILNLSDGEFFHENRRTLTERFRMNNFPEIEIIRLMQENYTLMKPIENTKKRSVTYGSLPLMESLTGKIQKAINILTPELTIAGRPNRKNGNIWSNMKDPTRREEKTNMIINVKCNCGKRILFENTKYKENCAETLTRLKLTHKMGTENCDQGHTFNFNEVIYLNGSNTWQKTRKKTECLAYAMELSTQNRIPLPNKRWRRHILEGKNK